jgi:hypothetical protein
VYEKKDPGKLLDDVATKRPMDADALRGAMLAGQDKYAEATELLLRAFRSWQTDPWVRPRIVSQALAALQTVARRCNDPALARQIYDVLQQPFAAELMRERRLLALVEVARYTAAERINPQVREALSPYAAFPLWQKDFLEQRVRAYDALKDANIERAALDLREFRLGEPIRFGPGLRKTEAAVATR